MKIKRYIKFILFLILLGFLAFLYGFSIHRNQLKKIGEPKVEFVAGDNHFLTHSIVDKLLIQNQSAVKNQPKSVLDLHELEQKVLANPYVEKAKVFVTINGDLKTVIKQREPVARIVDKSSSYYIDKKGVKIPLSNNFSARVLLVSGVKLEENLKQVTALVNKILSDNFLKKEIISIELLKQHEFKFYVRSGDYTIQFGKFANAEIKFKKLKAFYNKAYTDKTIGTYKTINVKYHNQVVCTK